jgi:hypothetical protein
MSEWRRRALEALPDLRKEIEVVPNVMSLWIDLRSAFEAAYEAMKRNRGTRNASARSTG